LRAPSRDGFSLVWGVMNIINQRMIVHHAWGSSLPSLPMGRSILPHPAISMIVLFYRYAFKNTFELHYQNDIFITPFTFGLQILI
jgi:hypothetical protein